MAIIKKQSISKNFGLQFIYQLLVLVIPLILSPFLTRRLGATALGTYSYIHTISYFFVIFAMLGISRYGQRLIAQNINDVNELRKAFWSLFCAHALISSVCIIVYLGLSFFFAGDDYAIYLIEGLYVLSALFDVTWFFYGIENFKSVVVKNAIVKVVECVLLIILVNQPTDLWIYTLITALGVLIGQIVLLPQIIFIVKPIRIRWVEVLKHIKPLLIFFIAILATTMYTAFDKALLGLMSTRENVAFYEYSNMVVSVPKILIGVIGTVMFPRACKMAQAGDIEGQKKYINYSYIVINFIAMASIFGILGLSTQFATIYYGAAFSECGMIIIALSPAIYIIGIGEVVRTQYMIPNKMDVQFAVSVVLSAVLNILLTVLLIPILGVYGAVLGTISAELCGLIIQTVMCRKFIIFKKVIKHLIGFALIGIVMLGVIEVLKLFLLESIVSLLIEFIVGAIVFSSLSFVYIWLFEKEIILVAKEKLKNIIDKRRFDSD